MGSLNLSCPNFCSLDFLITGKCVHPDSKPGRSRLSVLTSEVFMAFDLYSPKVIMSSGIIITSHPFLKNGGRYCFGVRHRIRRLSRLSPRFASYLGCY